MAARIPFPRRRGPRAMPAELQLLQREHDNFRRLLREFETELARFRFAGTPDYGLMRDIMLYLSQYPDHVHHPREDRILERLLHRRRGDARAQRLLRHVLQDHERMAAQATELAAALDNIGGDAMYPREAVVAMAADYAAHLREHMEREEQSLLPLARQHLTAADWAALAAAAPEGDDPLAAPSIPPGYRALFERLGPLRPPRRPPHRA